jgi:tetratricopeptide (TPR) repeat protein
VVGDLRVLVPGDHFQLAYYRQYLAYNRYRAGELDEALAGYREALAMYRRLGTHLPQVADLQETMAALLDDMGRIEEAEPLVRELLPLVVEVYGGDGGGSAVGVHNRLGVIALARGRFDEALQEAERGLRVAERHFGPGHRYAASQWMQQGSVLLATGRLEAAAAAFRRAERIRRTALTADSPAHMSTAIGFARLALAQGRAVEAETRLQGLLDRRGPTQLVQVELESTLALAIAQQGRHAEGRALLITALERLPVSHWRRQAQAAAAGLPPFVVAPSPSALAEGRRVLDLLSRRLGPQAPSVTMVKTALAAAGG